MQRIALVFMIGAVTGCAAHDQILTSSNSAELGFSRVAAPGGLAGKFDSVDGTRLDGPPLTIRVSEGRHVIGYSCPDVISVDFQAEVSAPFVRGRRYVLDCNPNAPGVVREQ